MPVFAPGIRTPKFGSFTYLTNYEPKRRFKEAFENPQHPLRAPLRDKWNRWPRDTLRCVFVAYDLPKAVMRNRVRRRVKAALHESLRRHGYNEKARTEGDAGGRSLHGTLLFTLNPNGLHAGQGDLIASCDRVVKHIEQVQREVVKHLERVQRATPSLRQPADGRVPSSQSESAVEIKTGAEAASTEPSSGPPSWFSRLFG